MNQLLLLWIEHSVTSLGDLLDFGNFLKPFATINLPKSSIKIYHFSSEIIFGQLL